MGVLKLFLWIQILGLLLVVKCFAKSQAVNVKMNFNVHIGTEGLSKLNPRKFLEAPVGSGSGTGRLRTGP